MVHLSFKSSYGMTSYWKVITMSSYDASTTTSCVCMPSLDRMEMHGERTQSILTNLIPWAFGSNIFSD